MSRETARDILTNALRYWESRRIIYNLLLLGVVVWHLHPVAAGYTYEGWTSTLGSLFVLAVLANVLYCAAYLPDILIQFSNYRQRWLRCRWLLLGVGCLFAVYWANFIAAGMAS